MTSLSRNCINEKLVDEEEERARLMKALGDDGLDEFWQVQLDAIAGESDSEDEDDIERGNILMRR